MVITLSVIVLILIFAAATKLPINMGILAFAGAFGMALVSGIALDDLIEEFPGDMFVIVVGVTLLFAIARANGTLDLVVDSSLRLVRGRRWAIVCVMFMLSGLIMAMGCILAAGMMAPIAMQLAAKKKINPLLMGMAVNHGALSCAFSPVTIFGAFVNGMMSSTGLGESPLLLWSVPFALNLLLFIALFACHGRRLFKEEDSIEAQSDSDGRGADEPVSPTSSDGLRTAVKDRVQTSPDPVAHGAADTVPRLTPIRVATLSGIVLLIVASIAFGLDVGVTAFCVSAVLLLLTPHRYPKVLNNVAWPAVSLVCGMLTYMTVLEMNGTLDFLGEAATSLGSPLLTAFVLCFSVGLISAFGSSIGTIGIVLPLATPMLQSGDIGAVGFVIAVAFCATVVDISPFATNGSIVVAEAQVPDRQAFQKKVLGYCMYVVAVAPLLAWGLVILPTTL